MDELANCNKIPIWRKFTLRARGRGPLRGRCTIVKRRGCDALGPRYKRTGYGRIQETLTLQFENNNEKRVGARKRTGGKKREEEEDVSSRCDKSGTRDIFCFLRQIVWISKYFENRSLCSRREDLFKKCYESISWHFFTNFRIISNKSNY